MSAIIYHRHHIIPRHAGGTDDPSNIILLTVEEHAEAHRILWEQHGRIQDKVAWLMLSGKTQEGEIARLEMMKSPEIRAKMSAASAGRKTTIETKEKLRNANLGKKHPHRKETKEKISKTLTGIKRLNCPPLSEEHRKKISSALLGRPRSEETRKKISIAHKRRSRMKRIIAPEVTIYVG